MLNEPPLPHSGRGPRRPAPEPPTGPLHTVVVAGPGNLRWGIVVRAADADAARAHVAGRGHQVLGVREGAERGPVALRNILGNCVGCGYSLVRLPAGAAGEVMCPECGLVNTPSAPLEARMNVLRRRRRFARLGVYLWLALVAAFIAIVSLLMLVRG